MSDLRESIGRSIAADRVRLPARVILRRGDTTPAAIADLVDGEPLPSGGNDRECCELEVGGSVVARGRIAAKGDRQVFVCEVLL